MTIGALETVNVKVQGLNAAFVGDALNDTVANFLGATLTFGGPNAAAHFSILHDAALGTRIQMLLPGKYEIVAELSAVGVAGASTLCAGITLDAPAGQLNTDPHLAGASVLDSHTEGKPAADVSAHSAKLVAVIEVTQAMANDPLLGIVRVQISNNADAAPTALSMTVAECGFRIVKVSDQVGS